ncbi:hypothetical protein [Kitasatospora kifunensis]|uniref:Glycosyltransferase n=1 Tax=Kitasatospora kifunensis TaxID=58351 RepID=A0A7W7VYW4_KITKI|nr:hypothetical protein [Kitasatospora kifunensis]MBB4927463.1 hypothetical protein [Kitasatospora kifunensis]
MRVLMGAQNCGFGPASALVAVSRLLAGHERVFVGDGVSAMFARRNADAFHEIRELPESGERSGLMDELLASCDQVVSVMDADLVVRAVMAGRPALMVDSLFSFWRLTRPLAEIHELCVGLPRRSFAAADEHLSRLSPHERIVAAHLLASHSVVQNFPGVPERMAEFATVLASGTGTGTGPELHLTGSIIDLEGLRTVPRATDPQYELLVNIGGFKNFLLDFDANDGYLRLLRRWIPDLLRDWPRFPRVLVCGGPFGGRRESRVSVAGRRADYRFLPQRELLRQVAGTPHCLLAPGLTALHESMTLGQLPLALHEQHYAHTFTVHRLGHTRFGQLAARFADVLPHHPVPDDDFAGTAALVAAAEQVLADDGRYARFRRTFNDRIERYVSLTQEQRQQGVEELRAELGGAPVSSVLAGIIPRSAR